MKRLVLLIFILGLFNIIGFAQKYPVVILPGQQKIITASNDTLWVLKNSQVNNALIQSKQLKICEKEFKNTQQQINILKQQYAQKDSMYQATVKMMNKYKSNWEDCKASLNGMADDYKKALKHQRLLLLGTATASIVSFVLGAIIF